MPDLAMRPTTDHVTRFDQLRRELMQLGCPYIHTYPRQFFDVAMKALQLAEELLQERPDV